MADWHVDLLVIVIERSVPSNILRLVQLSNLVSTLRVAGGPMLVTPCKN